MPFKYAERVGPVYVRNRYKPGKGNEKPASVLVVTPRTFAKNIAKRGTTPREKQFFKAWARAAMKGIPFTEAESRKAFLKG